MIFYRSINLLSYFELLIFIKSNLLIVIFYLIILIEKAVKIIILITFKFIFSFKISKEIIILFKFTVYKINYYQYKKKLAIFKVKCKLYDNL